MTPASPYTRQKIAEANDRAAQAFVCEILSGLAIGATVLAAIAYINAIFNA